MKYIEKGEEPEEFTEWKDAQSPVPVWDNLSGSGGIKPSLHESLMVEQGYICCYCGSRIASKQDSHIEHFLPRSRYPAEAFEYSNLLASCEGGTNPGVRPKERHCGHRKGEWYDPDLTVSPLDPECERYFRYMLDGEAAPVNDPAGERAGQATIDRLGLNSPRLVRARKAVLAHLTRLLDEPDTLNPDAVNRLIIGYSHKDSRGRYEAYCTALVYVLDRFLLRG